MPKMTSHYRAKLAKLRRIESSPNTINWTDGNPAPLHDAHCRVPFDATDSRSTGAVLGGLLQVIRDYGAPVARFGISPLLQRRAFVDCGAIAICGRGYYLRSHEMPETGPFPWFNTLTKIED